MSPRRFLLTSTMRFRSCLIFGLLQCLVVASASAQAADNSDVLAHAEELSTAGKYSSVVALLETHVQEYPAGAEAWLLLAQHRYWTQDVAGARRTFSLGLRHHPTDQELRLAYARFLLENGEADVAEKVLETFGSNIAEAEVLRGTLAWWAGDLTAAVRHFKRALELDSTLTEADAALSSILAEARPWIRVGGQAATDNQPLARGDASAEAGFFITPLQTLRAEINHLRVSVAQSVTPMTLASAAYQSFWPAAKIETKLAAGVVYRMDSTYWTGRLDAGYRLPYGVRVGARWERTPYLYTEASISQSVLTSTIQVNVSADRAGWLGEAALQRERFPDDNSKDVVYGWLMAPLIRTNTISVKAGYAYGYQDAAESRFAPVIASAPGPGRPPEWEGRYEPYYTPLNVQTHSVTGSITVQPSGAVSFRANGSYGFSGSEEAPYIYLAGRGPMSGTYEHRIRPWTARGGIDIAIGPTITLQMEGSLMATAWYDASTLNLSVYARL